MSAFEERGEWFRGYWVRVRQGHEPAPPRGQRLICVCCGYPTLEDAACGLCGWLEDGGGASDPDRVRPAAHISLTIARLNFERAAPADDKLSESDRLRQQLRAAFDDLRAAEAVERPRLWTAIYDLEDSLAAHGEPADKKVVAGPPAPRRLELLPLICPFCGGKLVILPNGYQLECAHCGNNYLLPSAPGLAQKVHLLAVFIAGFQYHAGMQPEVAAQLRDGLELRLAREPGNPHDGNAIQVLTLDGHHLGYIPRSENSLPALIADQSVQLGAEIVRYRPEAPAWERVLIRVYQHVASSGWAGGGR